jgi:hypothetical protein
MEPYKKRFTELLNKEGGDWHKAKADLLREKYPGLRNRNRPRWLIDEEIELGEINPAEEVIEYEAPGVTETALTTNSVLSETTPLIGATAGAGASGVSGSTIAAGAGGAAAIIGGGGALFHYLKNHPEEVEDNDYDDPRDKQQGESIIFPKHKKPIISVDSEHNYLGPGNTVGTDNDPIPVSDADRIAYNHDLNYLKAQSEQDIRDADSAAVAEFANKALEGDWRSAVGAVGLQTKQVVEKFTGQLYPGKRLLWLPGREVLMNLILKFHLIKGLIGHI